MTTKPSPALGRTLLVLHTAVASGPARSFVHRLPLCTEPGHRIVLVPDAGPAGDSFAGIADVRITDHQALAVPSGIRAMLRTAVRAFGDLRLFLRVIKQDRVETVICATTYTPMAMLASRIRRRKTIVYCGEILFQSADERRTKALAARALVALITRSSDLIVCGSDLVRSQFQGSAKAVTVYPSIAVDELMRSRKVVRTSDPLTLGVVGAITRGRGQDIAIQALALLVDSGKDVRLRIAGQPLNVNSDRSFVSEIHAAARTLELSGRIELVGNVDNISTFYESVNIVVNPAIVDEAFGRVAYEALAAGCGVVLSETGASRELLGEMLPEAFVPSSDPAALADAIRRLCETEGAIDRQLSASSQVLQRVRSDSTDRDWLNALASMAK